MNKHREIKRVFTKTILTYGKDVTMTSRTQTTEVLLRWKYVRQAVGRALHTWGEVTSQSLWSRHDRHFVGTTRHNALR